MAKTHAITKRIKKIVDRFEFGNISAAATRLKVSQRGMAKIYHGETESPGYEILAKIAEKYPVDPCWLLTGAHSDVWANSEERVEREASARAVRYIHDMLIEVSNREEDASSVEQA